MKIRWIILLALCCGVLGCVWYAHKASVELDRLEQQRRALRTELQQIRRLENELQEKARLIKEWNMLWASVDDAGLDPQKDWFVNPINTRAEAEWPDIANLITYVSYGDGLTTGYWFAPEFLHVNRVLPTVEPDGDAETDATDNQQENADARGGESRSQDDENRPERFQVHLKGRFLIPRN